MSDKRILISYFFGDDMIPLGVSCANAFRSFGYEVYCFNSQMESKWDQALLKPVNKFARTVGYKNREIGRTLSIAKINFKKQMMVKAALAFRPKWLFVIRAHEFVDEALVHELKQKCGVEKIFAWRVDGPLDSPDLLQDAKIYDHYFCSHRHGYDPQKDKIIYLPVYGMDFSMYRNSYPNSPRRYSHEIVLIAGYNQRRQKFVDQLLDLPIEIYGKWLRHNRFNFALRRHIRAKGAWGGALLDIYNASKIVLNISGWDPARFTGLNLRVFDVPATGAFLLTDYSPELEEFYKVGEEIVCFSEVEELREKSLYFLQHEGQREAIARRGYERALTLPTIADRMRALVAHVGA
jgi:spore maturation protein CgeB